MRKQKEHSRTFFGRFKSIQNTMLVSFSVLMVIAVVIFLVIAMNSTKKTITSEERKNLFRVFYKKMYSEHARKEYAYDEWLSFVTDERNNILNIRTETTNWQNILKKKLKTN